LSVLLKDENLIYETSFKKSDISILPYDFSSDLIRNNVVLFPSEAIGYGNDTELIKDITDFVHKYLEISEPYEKLVPYYVLFSWIYDNFRELPYLRAIGDYGCGKSRFLKVIGSLCYKPIFTVGATTPAPIFRILDSFRGTLILDEADMRFSDTTAEIIKILNNGFQEGMPVLRCGTNEENFDVRSFNVFGPKIIATRGKFDDQALESRFLVEHMDGILKRKDISLNIDEQFEKEALVIRNKCLYWRLKNYGKRKIDPTIQDPTLESRLNQIIIPLSSVIKDDQMKVDLQTFMRDYNRELIDERGFSFEASLLEAVISEVKDDSHFPSLKNITLIFNANLAEREKHLSPRKMGYLIRSKFGIKTIRTSDGYKIDMDSFNANIEKLLKRYGINYEQVNIVNVSEKPREVSINDISF
jgi:hypothetical protein